MRATDPTFWDAQLSATVAGVGGEQGECGTMHSVRGASDGQRELMTMGVHGGRFTAEVEGDFVVFLIGMRFNKPWKVRKWWPVATAMPRMVRVIDEHPELGCLGYQQWIGRTTILVQYWRSFEDLDHFARDSDLPHLEPWRQFNKVVRDSGDVGIWHETFKVRAGEYEAVYGNMPAFGLAAAAGHVPVGHLKNSAAARIGASDADEPVVDPY